MQQKAIATLLIGGADAKSRKCPGGATQLDLVILNEVKNDKVKLAR
jgi:hypothetical protein